MSSTTALLQVTLVDNLVHFVVNPIKATLTSLCCQLFQLEKENAVTNVSDVYI